MNIITYGVPKGYGYIRTGVGKCYFTPVKIELSLPDGYAMLRRDSGEPIEVYTRPDVIQEVKDHIMRVARQIASEGRERRAL